MLLTDDFNIIDPSLKTEEWGLRMVRYLTYNSQSLVWDRNVYELRAWENSSYPLEEFKRPYLHLISNKEGGTATPEDAQTNFKIDFTRLGLFEITKNVLGGEIDKHAINIDANCFDPTIVAKKEDEIQLLENKRVIEATTNSLYRDIGIPTDYKVGNQGEFESNMDDFESMGLNSNRPEDIQFFATTFYRHKLEIYSSDFINYLNKLNELNEIQKNHINDMISLKAIAMQTYYNTSTGLPSTKYLRPESIRFTGVTTRNDQNDAISKMWQQPMIVGDFLKLIGDEDLTEKDYNDILKYAYIGPGSAPSYQGELFPNGVDFSMTPEVKNGCCSVFAFLQFTINVGYVEWKTTDRNEIGRYFQKTMKAYFINNLTIPYKLFKFGYLNVMSREGYESELSCFSIQTYRISGPSMLEISIPYFKMIVTTWFKLQWFILSAKPSGYSYEINSLRRVAQEVISNSGDMNDVIALMKMFKESPDSLYSNGDENSEIRVGGNGLPYQERKNGLDPSTEKFIQLIAWCKAQIREETGINAARIAQSPAAEEAYKKTQLIFDQSENATEYINSALDSLYSGSAYRIFFIIQAITEFDLFGKEQLEKIFGDKYIWAVKHMKKIPIQYFGITFKRFLREREREEIRKFTNDAVLKKEIPVEVASLINDVDSWQKAAAVLTYYKERTRKQLLQEQLRLQQAAQQAQQAAQQGKMQEIQLQGQIDLAIEQEITKRTLAAAELTGDKKIEQQAHRLEQQPGFNAQKSELKKQQDTHIAALDATQQILKGDAKSQ